MKKHRSFTVKCNTVVVIHVVVAAVVKVSAVARNQWFEPPRMPFSLY